MVRIRIRYKSNICHDIRSVHAVVFAFLLLGVACHACHTLCPAKWRNRRSILVEGFCAFQENHLFSFVSFLKRNERTKEKWTRQKRIMAEARRFENEAKDKSDRRRGPKSGHRKKKRRESRYATQCADPDFSSSPQCQFSLYAYKRRAFTTGHWKKKREHSDWKRQSCIELPCDVLLLVLGRAQNDGLSDKVVHQLLR